jgi:hypothetical protein
MPSVSHYEVTHKATGKVTRYATSKAATTACNRADRAYGKSITTRRAVWADAA